MTDKVFGQIEGSTPDTTATENIASTRGLRQVKSIEVMQAWVRDPVARREEGRNVQWVSNLANVLKKNIDSVRFRGSPSLVEQKSSERLLAATPHRGIQGGTPRISHGLKLERQSRGVGDKREPELQSPRVFFRMSCEDVDGPETSSTCDIA